MKLSLPNARVVECGQPFEAVYLATHVDESKHYMQIRYGKMNSRKWVKRDRVTLHEGVNLVYVEKVSELNGQEA